MNLLFKPVERIVPTAMFRQRPQAGERFVCFGGPGSDFEILIHVAVLDRVSNEVKAASPNETIGLLAGRVCRDGRGFYAVVEASEAGLPAEIEAAPGFVRISSAGNASVRERLEAAHPCLEIIGWYHSHPHSPPCYSAEDRNEQSTWTNPHCVGLVVSGLPNADPYGVYWGRNSVLLQQPRTASLFRPTKTGQPENEGPRREIAIAPEVDALTSAPAPPELALVPTVGIGLDTEPARGRRLVTWALRLVWVALAASLIAGAVWGHFCLENLTLRVQQLEDAANREAGSKK